MSVLDYSGIPKCYVTDPSPRFLCSCVCVEGKPVFQNLLQKMLVQNEHRVTVEMIPDEGLEARM